MTDRNTRQMRRFSRGGAGAKARRKDRRITAGLVLMLAAGLALFLYPLISDSWNALHQSRVIADYTQAVTAMPSHRYQQMLEDARAYNAALLRSPNRYHPTEEENAWYERALDVSGNGVMGYLEIPSIQASLPLYHGVEEAVLQTAIGHIQGSSLPVGGESIHCVVSGHRGLPSAKLFTDLDQLQAGDTFSLRVLDEVLVYQVDQIRIVEPQQLELLEIEKGKDLCTLVTCTHYGVNSHRLLIRGQRVDTASERPVRWPAAGSLAVGTLAAAAVGMIVRRRSGAALRRAEGKPRP